MVRANRNQGTFGCPPLTGLGRDSKSASVVLGCVRGSSRKYQAQIASHTRLTAPTATNDPRQVVTAKSAIISGGATALPTRAHACVMPCANPHWLVGTQMDIARVAVEFAAPSPKPKAIRAAINDAYPPATPVDIVDMPTIAQHTVKTTRGPNVSPTRPPTS